MKANMSYSSAFTKLRKIVEQMESDEIQVDELADKVRQAKELISFCENKLRLIETEVQNAMGEQSNSDDVAGK